MYRAGLSCAGGSSIVEIFAYMIQMIHARRSTGDVDAEKAFGIDEELAIIHTAKKFSMLGAYATRIVCFITRRAAQRYPDARSKAQEDI